MSLQTEGAVAVSRTTTAAASTSTPFEATAPLPSVNRVLPSDRQLTCKEAARFDPQAKKAGFSVTHRILAAGPARRTPGATERAGP
jgi:hypothetical protein